MYQVSYSREWHFFEIVFFIIIGVFGGLSGAFFIKMSLYIQKLRANHPWIRDWPVFQVSVIAFVTAFLSYLNEFTRVDSSELLENLFRECTESNFNGLCEYLVYNLVSINLLLL